MIDLPSALSAKAHAVVPGPQYNEHRRALIARDERIMVYEAMLTPERPWQTLVDKVMPPMARYLTAKRMDPERPRGVMIALFLGEQCYVLPAEDLVALYLEGEGLDREGFRMRVRGWLRHGD